MSAGRYLDNDDSQATEEGFQLLKWAGGMLPQGALVQGAKGAWKATWLTFMKELAPQSKDGAYSRPGYSFTDAISSAPGTKYPVQAGRYHVYTGNACPWCHRVLLVLAIRGLRGDIGVGELHDNPEKATRGGWVFPGMKDPVSGCRDLYGVYNRAHPGFIGRCTAPCLVDTKTFKIVSNESSDIVRMLGSADFPGSNGVDLYPKHLRSEIDSVNALVYNKINNGVYKSGFATTQVAYDKAQKELYEGLDEMEQRLGKNRFLVGDRFTEADLRLYPTIIRYDTAYAVLFKCSKRRIEDYPNLSAWLRDVYQLPCLDADGTRAAYGIQDTFNLDDARRSYSELFPINPGGIVPSGPGLEDLCLNRPADRGSCDWEDIFHVA